MKHNPDRVYVTMLEMPKYRKIGLKHIKEFVNTKSQVTMLGYEKPLQVRLKL